MKALKVFYNFIETTSEPWAFLCEGSKKRSKWLKIFQLLSCLLLIHLLLKDSVNYETLEVIYIYSIILQMEIMKPKEVLISHYFFL